MDHGDWAAIGVPPSPKASAAIDTKRGPAVRSDICSQGAQMRGFVIVLGIFAAAGCGGNSGGARGDASVDAARSPADTGGDACSPSPQADMCDQSSGLKCIDGRCQPACMGIDGGTICGGGPSGNPLHCCGPTERCCPVAGETSMCVPLGEPCPRAAA
ncbi:MAG TPA: hypothetical protein VGQ83_07865 [Polyangia bacterium]|jgi:hypothetical protein